MPLSPSERRARRLAAGAAFALGFALFGSLQLGRPWLYDTDAGYHLAVAREVWHHGSPATLPWARFSILSESFGDKELLFHYLLSPFAGAMDPLDGGRWALALLDGAVFAVIAWGAFGALGRAAPLLPLALALLSIDWDWRMVRLRPELTALVLFVAAARAAAARRYLALGAIGFLFALSYVAVHSFVGLCGLWFLVEGLVGREWRPRLLLFPALGAALGWIVHPGFPGNLAVFWIQSVHFFRMKRLLDVGSEILPETTDVLLLASAGLWLAGLALWRARRAADPASEEERREFRAYGTAAAVFVALFLAMSRFVVYAIPFAALAFVAGVRIRGERIGGRIRLVAGRELPLVLGLAAALAAATPTLVGHARVFRERTAVGPDDARRRDLEDFARALPDGALVAAPWGATDLYVLFAPQARYLDVLDPVFFALRDPAAYALQRRLFAGDEPDVPSAVALGLDSRYLALPRAGAAPRLLARLAADPRVRRLHDGGHLLYEMLPDRVAGFAREWRALDGGGAPAPESSAAGRFAGFVDLGAEGCRRLATDWRAPGTSLELSGLGAATLSLEGAAPVGVGPTGAVLGEGLRLEVGASAAARHLEVESCPDPASGRNGFYLLSR